jgi:hypothetical protein
VLDFVQFENCCNVVSSQKVDAKDIFNGVSDAVTYGHHVMNSLTAHIGGQLLPAPPVLSFLSSYLPPAPAATSPNARRFHWMRSVSQ